VIKIESNANFDFLRRVTVEPGAPNRSWTFNDASRGHRSVCLDLRTPRGRELALRLCAAADVVIENNRGDVVCKWKLDYEDVHAVRPDVVYLASQGFGVADRSARRPRTARSTRPSPASRGSGTIPTRRTRQARRSTTPTTSRRSSPRSPCWRRSSTGGGPARAS